MGDASLLRVAARLSHIGKRWAIRVVPLTVRGATTDPKREHC